MKVPFQEQDLHNIKAIETTVTMKCHVDPLHRVFSSVELKPAVEASHIVARGHNYCLETFLFKMTVAMNYISVNKHLLKQMEEHAS